MSQIPRTKQMARESAVCFWSRFAIQLKTDYFTHYLACSEYQVCIWYKSTVFSISMLLLLSAVYSTHWFGRW